MTFRLKAWQLPVLIVVVCGAILLGLREWRARQADPSVLVRRFPATVTTVLYVDVAALNSAGILAKLAGQPGTQEADYLRFVEETAFDYQRDLRSVMFGFAGANTYALASGAFDWDVLRNYAETRNGTCRFSICRMPAYGNNRVISWAPLHKNVIALAIGPDQWSAAELTTGAGVKRTAGPIASPLWLSISGKALRNASSLPEGTRSFTRVLESAERIMLAVRQQSGSDLEMALSAECNAPDVASRVARELGELTATLNKMLEREKRKPNPSDLSGVLSGGRFTAQSQTVTGSWPLPRPFMETLLASNP